MELKGKIKIFPELKVRKSDKGEESFIVCRGTISSKQENGTYLNKSVNVRFAGTNFPKDKVNKLDPSKCYDLEIETGFLSVNETKALNGTRKELEIVVLEGKLANPKVVERPVEAKSEDLPF